MKRTATTRPVKAALALPLFIALVVLPAISRAGSARPPDKGYYVYVVCESVDKVAVVSFGPRGARLERQLDIGAMPTDIDGPHGIVFSPDRQFYYVSFGHGRPYGAVWKYSSKDHSAVGRVTLGLFPATMDVTPDGSFLYVVNFNLHGDMVPSSVSIIETEGMNEVARVPTCTMPHGSRINPQGTRQYSACMMDDTLVEIDANTLKVSRHFMLARGKEAGMMGPPHRSSAASHSRHDPGDQSCSPTWAQPSSDGKSVYVACNKSDEIVEIEAASWKLKRRMAARPGVYNLAVTRDGRLIATNKRDQSVSIFDLKSGSELARLPTRRKVVHGAVVSPDDRYAFISVEGVGSEPGTVEIIDLQTLKTVATVDVPEQAAGIDFYKMEPSR